MLTNVARLNLAYQGKLRVLGIAGGGRKLWGEGSLLTTNLEAMQVEYNMVIRMDWALDDDYMVWS